MEQQTPSTTDNIANGMFWIVGIFSFFAALGSNHSAGEAFFTALICGGITAAIIHVVSFILKLLVAAIVVLLMLARIASLFNALTNTSEAPRPYQPVYAQTARYEAPAPPVLPEDRYGACIHNSHDGKLIFAINAGGTDQTLTLEPGTARCFHGTGTADWILRIDTDFAEGYTGRTFPIQRANTGPFELDSRATHYDLVVNHPRIGVRPRHSQPGFPDPFNPQHVQGDTQGQSRCAPGLQWQNPEDPNDLTCVPQVQ